MQHQVMGYDRSATMFSPDGHLLQVEYAEKAVRVGSVSIGLKCKDGIIIIADRRVRDKLIAPESANKISEIDSHIIGTAAGILSDARVLVERAQLISQQNRLTFDSSIDVVSIIKEVSDSIFNDVKLGIKSVNLDNENNLIFINNSTLPYFGIQNKSEMIKKIDYYLNWADSFLSQKSKINHPEYSIWENFRNSLLNYKGSEELDSLNYPLNMNFLQFFESKGKTVLNVLQIP